MSVIFWLLLATSFTRKCETLRLGTVLLETDKIISRSLKTPEEASCDAVVQNLRIYIKSLRILRDQQATGLNKRNQRLTEALINQGRPNFLRYNIDSMVKMLKYIYYWKTEDVDTTVELFKEAERIRDEIQRHYKRLTMLI